MAGRKRAAVFGGSTGGSSNSRRSTRGAVMRSRDKQPDIYQELLEEAGVGSVRDPTTPEQPLKKRRIRGSGGGNEDGTQATPSTAASTITKGPENERAEDGAEDDDDEDDNEDFEDVLLPAPTVQTMERESEDEDDDEDEDDELQFEDVDFSSPLKDPVASTSAATVAAAPSISPQELELNLSAQKAASIPSKSQPQRRKPITREEKQRRVEVHKTHLLCLLAHVARRNRWCNDPEVQDALRPLLSNKAVTYLTPGAHLPQFGQAESLKNGLQMARTVWGKRFEVTERGMWRALWAEDGAQAEEYELPDDMEFCHDRNDFREAANSLQGSRDVGAQLYCAMLRSVGVRARLVCSLQPLPFSSAAPNRPKAKRKSKASGPSPGKGKEKDRSFVDKYKEMASSNGTASSERPTARRRLGHPNATAYNFEPTAAPPKAAPAFQAPKRIRESQYPIYWVEVLDTGHQKWQPVDAVVTKTFWKPRVLEPPITDKENSMTYVVAFEADGSAKDVTRRYAKAYTAKTRRLRIETAVEDGEKWWRKAMKHFRKPFPDDLEQIENIELTAVETREPMPRNVQDFKDHPIYALERHLRRHEVLMPGAVPSGTIGAGSRAPLEKIYRRKDVRIARTEDKWYRLGRVVKPMEIPVKWLPKKVRNKDSLFDDVEEQEDDGLAGVPLYTTDQTDLYEPPRVRNGIVPKNKFGNIDVYVPSMVPRGGSHILDEHAARAAFLLGIDYAPALTGFQFRGRHGTAVLSGVVVARENEEAVRAVIAGLADGERAAEEERRRVAALRVWRRLLMGLRIRERIWRDVDEGERREAEAKAEAEVNGEAVDDGPLAQKEDDEAEEGGHGDGDREMDDAASDVTEEFDMVADEYYDDGGGGGGFLIE